MLPLSLKWARIGHELYFVDQDMESVLVFDWYIVQRHNILLELQKKCDKFDVSIFMDIIFLYLVCKNVLNDNVKTFCTK